MHHEPGSSVLPRRGERLNGAQFEARSAALLERYGLRIIARRYQCRRGEIDLIAVDEHRLLFVEVRARRSLRHGGATASVDARKRARIARCAAGFLQHHPQWRHLPCRFDVIVWEPACEPLGEPRNPCSEPTALEARWIQAAFLT